ncbi:hypothetical protein HZC09_01550 [Candidatus Micrarchaeota archaeon]|nr:hypothetical protein [Candidatus Micrarchaeota archaeon]
MVVEKFDFAALAFERFKDKYGARGVVPWREVYRFFGCMYCFRKRETRLLLKEFKKRGWVIVARTGVRVVELARETKP